MTMVGPDVHAGLYSVFICYRHVHREFALQVRKALEHPNRIVGMDDQFGEQMTAHPIQSRVRIMQSGFVVVVLPPDFDEWLPQDLSVLAENRGTSDQPTLANEIEIVLERLDSARGPVAFVLMQTYNDGSWSPSPSTLPWYLRELPTVIPAGADGWQTRLQGVVTQWQNRVQPGGNGAKTDRRQRRPKQLMTMLAEQCVTWLAGRTGWRVHPGIADRYAGDFEYRHSFYVDLCGSPPPRRATGDGQPPPVDPPVPVRDWVLDGKHNYGWLVGNVGSGKTITMTKAAAVAANDVLDWDRRRHDSLANASLSSGDEWDKDMPRVPVLLGCPSFYWGSGESGHEASDFGPAALAMRMAAAREQRWDDLEGSWDDFLDLLRTYKVLLLLDGVDEIPDSEAANRLDATVRYLQSFKTDLRVIVATRDERTPDTAAVLVIKPLDADRGEELMEKIAAVSIDPYERGRMAQTVGPWLRLAKSGSGLDVLDTPLGLTIACRLASEPDFRPVEVRFGDILERMLEKACSERHGISREGLQQLALNIVNAPERRLSVAQATTIVNASQSRHFRSGRECEAALLRLAGVIRIVPQPNVHLVEFGHPSFLDFLAAEAFARSATTGLLRRVKDECRAWQRVAEFLPGIVARRPDEGLAAACALLDEFATEAGQDAARAAQIWTAGLKSIVNSEALQASDSARAFTLKARAAIDEAAGAWDITSRADALDVCGLAARPHLTLMFRSEWIPVPELESASRRIFVANSPVLVEEFARFVNDGDRADPRFWIHGGAPQFVYEVDEGAWYQQLRTPLRPVTGVSWYEATAFCAWLTHRSGEDGTVVRLPTRDEWKTIARPLEAPGTSQRDHPWSGSVIFNHRWVPLGRVSPVGLFPAYCRPGLFDFGTNVYEWSADKRSDRRHGDVEVLGGCFNDYVDYLRIDRPAILCPPEQRRPDTGFRCVREVRLSRT